MTEHPKCQFCKAPRIRCAYELITGYCKYKKKTEEEGGQEPDLEAETKEKHIEQVKDLMQHEQREDDQQAFDVLSDQADQQHDQPQDHDLDDDDRFSF
jgi:uncharacterized Zn finger protein (UPF0148 family)